MLLVQLAMTYLPLFNRLFHTAPIEWWWWPFMAGIGFAIFVMAELKKVLVRDVEPNPGAASSLEQLA